MNALVKPLVVSAIALGCASAVVLTQMPAPQQKETLIDGPEILTVRIEEPVAIEEPVDHKSTSTPGEMKYAVKPKPLSDEVKKGLAYLASNQQADGGWNQGGGWRTGTGQGGRVEGKEVEDPSDIGNTSIALMAFIRAGFTPTEGTYKDHIRKALSFVLERIEKADATSLHVTDVRNTQLQSKIGPYVDTFLANLVLVEMKGKAGDQEKRLAKCLDKTIDKIAKNQKGDGQFAGNGGWAPVLSQGLANKGLNRASQFGVQVNPDALANSGFQSQAVFNSSARFATAAGKSRDGSAGSIGGGIGGGIGGIGGGGGIGGIGGGGGGGDRAASSFGSPTGDAGVALYSIAQGAGGSQDVMNSLKNDADKAKAILANPKSSSMTKGIAKMQLKRLEHFKTENVKAQAQLRSQINNDAFVAGFGSNGGEEFLSFLNISEALVVAGGPDWEKWDKRMQDGLIRAQDKNGNWSGHHCITGKTFCTAAALLVLTADRTQFPANVIEHAKKDAAEAKKEPALKK